MEILHKIIISLWFADQAEEAVNFLTSIFSESKVGQVTRYGNEEHDIHGMAAGTVMTVEFQIAGQQSVALNGGPQFQFTEAISFIINCESQSRVDSFWEKLSQEGDSTAQQFSYIALKLGKTEEQSTKVGGNGRYPRYTFSNR